MSTEATEAAPIARLVESIGTVTLIGVDEATKVELDKDLDSKRIKQVRGKDYLAEHDVVRTANRIFGYGRWGTTVVWQELVGSAPMKNSHGEDGWYTGYRCCVRLTVAGCEPVDGIGYGDAFEKQWSAQITTHELAAKEAESDAIKRAFKKFGDQFGLILYAKAEDRQRIAAEKTQAEYDAPAPVEALQKLSQLATAKGKQVETAQLIEREQSEHGHVRTGRLLAIEAKLVALSEPKPAEAPVSETTNTEAEKTAVEQFAIVPPDRAATPDEVSSLISLAGVESQETAVTVTASILAHRTKNVGGEVSYAWLDKMRTALTKKINEPTPEPSAFAPPESTKPADDAALEAAFATEQAA